MPLAGAGHTSSEGDVVELAAIVFQQDCCFCAVDAGIAITEQEIQVAVIVEIADRATHSAPAASETKVGSDVGECAIAVVAKDPRGRAAVGALACTQRINGVLGTRPGELHDVQPPVIIDVAAYTNKADHGCINASCATHVGKRPVTVVVKKLRRAGIVDKEIEAAVVTEVAPCGTDGRPYRLQTGFLSDIGERAVAIVVEQAVRGLAVEQAAQSIDDEEIKIAIPIVVHPGGGEGWSPHVQPRLFGDIREGAV